MEEVIIKLDDNKGISDSGNVTPDECYNAEKIHGTIDSNDTKLLLNKKDYQNVNTEITDNSIPVNFDELINVTMCKELSETISGEIGNTNNITDVTNENPQLNRIINSEKCCFKTTTISKHRTPFSMLVTPNIKMRHDQ